MQLRGFQKVRREALFKVGKGKRESKFSNGRRSRVYIGLTKSPTEVETAMHQWCPTINLTSSYRRHGKVRSSNPIAFLVSHRRHRGGRSPPGTMGYYCVVPSSSGALAQSGPVGW
ncbi:unnamed protein product [Ectocarpus sp. 12 AP-2014]